MTTNHSIHDLDSRAGAIVPIDAVTMPKKSGGPNIDDYDLVVVAFSGGKDSVACVLHLLDSGVDPSKMELWHHDVDGREGGDLKMDWPCTPAYCRSFAEAHGIPIYFSWKQGGFVGEMLREDSLTRPTSFETPKGIKSVGGTRGKRSTRRKFPQVTADLSKRWCSAYLKIDVCSTALRNQERFNGIKTLLVTGERAQESAGRAKYKTFEPHKADLRLGKRTPRHIDHYRPVHKWDETEVWAIIKAHRINPHPCYRLGFNRASCMPCIFGNDDQWATVSALSPETVDTIVSYEESFGITIDRGRRSVRLRVIKGTPYPSISEADKSAAMSTEWNEPMIMTEGDWKLPAGSFKTDGCGPTLIGLSRNSNPSKDTP